VLILGGDITGKIIAPLVKGPDGDYVASIMGEDRKIPTKELTTTLEMMEGMGYYPYQTDARGREMLQDPATFQRIFEELARARLKRWLSFAEERLADSGVSAYVTGGNDDPMYVESILAEPYKRIVASEGKVMNIAENHEMISSGYSNLTPWKCPRDIPEDDLLARIENLALQVKDKKNCVFNLHCPPIDSGLDTCPKLDATSMPPKPVVKQGKVVMQGAGSVSVRKAIETYQPLLALHGHIHESLGAAKIGRTLCLNPGSEYGEGILKGALISLNNEKIKSYQFTSG
jgi:Icc-related predicted phosphoesterase